MHSNIFLTLRRCGNNYTCKSWKLTCLNLVCTFAGKSTGSKIFYIISHLLDVMLFSSLINYVLLASLMSYYTRRPQEQYRVKYMPY